jgi:hypothetical protein
MFLEIIAGVRGIAGLKSRSSQDVGESVGTSVVGSEVGTGRFTVKPTDSPTMMAIIDTAMVTRMAICRFRRTSMACTTSYSSSVTG